MNILLILLYRRATLRKNLHDREMVKKHLSYIHDHYPVLLPGDPLKEKISVCLFFEDAIFDVYHYLFPLMNCLKLRALLGVPVRYIQDSAKLPIKDRLQVAHPLIMQDGIFDTKIPFCTWQELDEMVKSGLFEVASHSYSHSNLTFPFVRLEREISLSKEILENKLPQAITSFLYPFGKYNNDTEKIVKNNFQFSFSPRSLFNMKWESDKPLHCHEMNEFKISFKLNLVLKFFKFNLI